MPKQKGGIHDYSYELRVKSNLLSVYYKFHKLFMDSLHVMLEVWQIRARIYQNKKSGQSNSYTSEN